LKEYARRTRARSVASRNDHRSWGGDFGEIFRELHPSSACVRAVHAATARLPSARTRPRDALSRSQETDEGARWMRCAAEDAMRRHPLAITTFVRPRHLLSIPSRASRVRVEVCRRSRHGDGPMSDDDRRPRYHGEPAFYLKPTRPAPLAPPTSPTALTSSCNDGLSAPPDVAAPPWCLWWTVAGFRRQFVLACFCGK
jgi:hypothetical protein